MEALENSRYYKWLTYIFLPCHLASLVAMCYFLTADDLSWLGGVYANNDGMALGAVNALQGKGYFKDPKKFMPVVGVDAIPDALAKIKEGVMVGSVLNDAKNQGLATLQLSVNAANGKDPLDGTTWKFDDKKSVRVPYVLINKDNLKVAEDAYK